MPAEDKQRIAKLLRNIGEPNVVCGSRRRHTPTPRSLSPDIEDRRAFGHPVKGASVRSRAPDRLHSPEASLTCREVRPAEHRVT
jgi:hypothetical protein